MVRSISIVIVSGLVILAGTACDLAARPNPPAHAGAPAQASTAVPESQDVVPLPPVARDGQASLDGVLQGRRSVRALAGTPISAQALAKLLWAAQGTTDDQGRRTVPSARATYPMDVIAVVGRVDGVAPGSYRYDPDRHALRRLAGGPDLAAFNEQVVRQDWANGAAVAFVITGTAERARAKLGDRADRFLALEAGMAAQNLLLAVTALELGATFVGGYDPERAPAILGLPAGEVIHAVVPVGVRR